MLRAVLLERRLSPAMTENKTETIPLVQEELTVGKKRVEAGRVRIRTVIDERLARVGEDLEQEEVSIERVAVNREVTQAPEVREENGVLIVPVLEEVLVVEKRLVVKEELHIRKKHKRERFEEAVRVRDMRAVVERLPPSSPASERLVSREK